MQEKTVATEFLFRKLSKNIIYNYSGSGQGHLDRCLSFKSVQEGRRGLRAEAKLRQEPAPHRGRLPKSIFDGFS